MNKKVDEFLIEVEKAYEMLENTVNEIKKLKDSIAVIKQEAENLTKVISTFSESEDFLEFKKINEELSEKVREEISEVNEQLSSILSFQRIYTEDVSVHAKRINNFNELFKNTVNDASKEHRNIMKTLLDFEKEYREQRKERDRLHKIANELVIVTNSEKIVEEQKEQKKMMRAILRKLNSLEKKN